MCICVRHNQQQQFYVAEAESHASDDEHRNQSKPNETQLNCIEPMVAAPYKTQQFTCYCIESYVNELS